MKCKTCKKEVAPIGKKFCNMNCYTDYKRKNQVELVCSYCGRKFSASKRRSKSVSHCSRFCYMQSANHAGQRICKDCKELKNIEEFNIHCPAKSLRRRYCVDCEKKRNVVRIKSPKARWVQAKNRSARSGDPWCISFEIFERLIIQKCHYCDGELNPTGCGLDRKNNLLDYTEDNVVMCATKLKWIILLMKK